MHCAKMGYFRLHFSQFAVYAITQLHFYTAIMWCMCILPILCGVSLHMVDRLRAAAPQGQNLHQQQAHVNKGGLTARLSRAIE